MMRGKQEGYPGRFSCKFWGESTRNSKFVEILDSQNPNHQPPSASLFFGYQPILGSLAGKSLSKLCSVSPRFCFPLSLQYLWVKKNVPNESPSFFTTGPGLKPAIFFQPQKPTKNSPRLALQGALRPPLTFRHDLGGPVKTGVSEVREASENKETLEM